MFNPIRRNRNIGTSKQGRGKNNFLKVPDIAPAYKDFTELLDEYTKELRVINGTTFEFVIEKTRKGNEHCCSVNDISEILKYVPKEDYGQLNLIVFRQPTKKEAILKSAWGRLIYSYDFENVYRPAIILEAFIPQESFKLSKSQTPEGLKEIERLKKDGHSIVTTKRNFIIQQSRASVRNTQLYRTLLHEIGHYKHLMEEVGEYDFEDTSDEDFKDYLSRFDQHISQPTAIKEAYAHAYADKMKAELSEKGIIPFDPL